MRGSTRMTGSTLVTEEINKGTEREQGWMAIHRVRTENGETCQLWRGWGGVGR